MVENEVSGSSERVVVNQHTSQQQAPPANIMSYQVADTPVQSQSSFPYLAKLTAFLFVLLSVLFSLSTLINYAVDKLIVKQQTNTDYSYFSGVDSFLVISAIATLIVALPASALLLWLVRRSENSETWRNSQKWRRIVYTIAQVVLVIAVISTLIGTVYTVFSHSLSLDVGSSYSGLTGSNAKNPDTGAKITAAIISGLAAVIIFSLGILALAGEYGAKWRSIAWGVLVIFSITASTVGIVSVIKVQEQVKKQIKEQSATQSQYDSYSDDQTSSNSSSSSSSSSSTSINSTSAENDLEDIRVDLNYYASNNSGKYPTQAQWDDSGWKKRYILIDEATVKKITYSPAGCETTGCASYTLSMKDENGKTVELKSI